MDSKNVKAFYNKKADNGFGFGIHENCGSKKFPLHVGESYAYLEDRIQTLVPPKTDVRLLDLCCGDGIHSLFFAQKGYQVEGHDISNNLIDIAQKWSKNLNLEATTHFCQTDLSQRFPFEANTFDILYISGSLYYLNMSDTLKEINRVLKPGAYFFCVETNGDNFLAGAWRRLKNKVLAHRDTQTLNNLLKKNDVLKLSENFDNSEIRYFGFLTLFGQFLKFSPTTLRLWMGITRPLDNFILNKFNLSSVGFKFVVIGQNKK